MSNPTHKESFTRLTRDCPLRQVVACCLLALLASTTGAAPWVRDCVKEANPLTSRGVSTTLTGVIYTEAGEALAVGDSGTLLLRSLAGVWSEVALPTSEDLLDVHCGAAAGCAITGWDVVLHNPGPDYSTGWSAVHTTTGLGLPYSPILVQADALFYGQIATAGPISWVWRRPFVGTPLSVGIFSPVLEMCDSQDGGIVAVKRDGDIVSYSPVLLETVEHDQPGGQDLQLESASFSSCDLNVRGPASDIELSGSSPGGVLNSRFAEYFDSVSQPSWRVLAQLDSVDELPATISFRAYLDPTIEGPTIAYGGTAADDDPVVYASPSNPIDSFQLTSISIPSLEGGLLDIAVGPGDDDPLIGVTVEGESLECALDLLLFGDGFESGALNAWSHVVAD